ncbi:histidinol-phosphate transaminase [Candidatus Uabimicrobium amorphum]|nr:histidinol-phosphate transaminase [Candidatus Uabimicrobium amorphum]
MKIKLDANENPWGPSPQVVEIIQQIATNLHRYPKRDDSELCDALSAKYNLTKQHFCVANSACDVIEMITRAFLCKQTQAIVCPPTFHIYEKMAKLQEAQVLEVALGAKDFSYNITQIIAAITPQTRVVFVCSPNNPTGSTLSSSQFSELLRGIPKDVLLVVDEVYKHFADDNDLKQSMHYTNNYRNLFIIHSFSKAYGLAGMRLGYGVSHPSTMLKIRKFYRTYHLNSLALAAGIAALNDEEHLQKSVAQVKEQRVFVHNELQKLGVQCWPSEGNFILIKPKDSEEMHKYLQQNNIAVGSTAKSGLQGGLRISIGLPEHNHLFLKSMEKYLQRSDGCKK